MNQPITHQKKGDAIRCNRTTLVLLDPRDVLKINWKQKYFNV